MDEELEKEFAENDKLIAEEKSTIEKQYYEFAKFINSNQCKIKKDDDNGK